jgi:Fur family zinc uptake transcriptional regulator
LVTTTRTPGTSPASPRRSGGAASIARQLDAAEAHCLARGAQLTALRREVLEALLLRDGTAKAYDLQDDMRVRHARVAPTTIYRALEFLMEQHLVHRVDATNAFVVCTGTHDDHRAAMLVCSQCGKVTEWHDEAPFAAIGKLLRKGFDGFTETGIEIKGICGPCGVAVAGTGGAGASHGAAQGSKGNG